MASISKKHYKPGDIILRIQEPLVWVTKYEHRLFTCDQCFKSTDSSIVCSNCCKVYYCSNYCKTKAWKRLHHLECPIFQRQKPMEFENQGIDYMQRLTLRLYLLLKSSSSASNQNTDNTNDDDNDANNKNINGSINNGEDFYRKPFILEHNDQIRTIEQMESHSEQLKDSDYFHGIENYFKFYKMFEDENMDYDLLVRCYGILHVNSFGIDCYDKQNQSIEHRGTGLYVEASIFDHSCVPNACAQGDGLVLEIRALSTIEPGQIIYIDYIQDVLTRSERIKILEDRYFFTCQCEFGCNPNLTESFDSNVDFKRLKILNNLIDSIDSNKQNPYDWCQKSHELRRQRLSIQEEYYRKARYHPCLSLYYQSMLRFLILNQKYLSKLKPENIKESLMKTREHLLVTHGKEHSFFQWIVGEIKFP